MTNQRRRAEQLAIVTVGAILVLGVNHVAGGDEPKASEEERGTGAQPSLLPESDKQRQPEPSASDPSACRGWDDEKKAVRDELTMLVQDAREGQRTLDGLEEEVRAYPEDRSKIAVDLRIARRDVQDSEREVAKSRHEIEVVNDDARSEGCGK
jgi:hypothetical protein